MSIFDTENTYPNDDFWLEKGFVDLKKRGVWINAYKKHLHWEISDTGTRWGGIYIYVEYNKYSKVLEIIQHSQSFYYNEVNFEPIKLHKPTQREIEMALSEEYLSSRLTYKYKYKYLWEKT